MKVSKFVEFIHRSIMHNTIYDKPLSFCELLNNFITTNVPVFLGF